MVHDCPKWYSMVLYGLIWCNFCVQNHPNGSGINMSPGLVYIQILSISWSLFFTRLKVCLKTLKIPIKFAEILYVALSDPDSMKFQQGLGPFHMDWRTTMHAKGFLTIFTEYGHTYYSWKIV